MANATAELTVEQLLRKADKRLSSPNAWCKGDFLARNRCCLVGALQYAATGNASIQTLKTRNAESLLRELTGMASAIHFNDDNKTTFKDVKALVKKAIKVAKERGI